MSCSVLLRMKNVSDKNCKKNQNMYSLCSSKENMKTVSDKNCKKIKTRTVLYVQKFPFRKSLVKDKMWKNILEPDRPQIKICHMRIACWIPKATDTFKIYSSYCCSAATTFYECVSTLRYTYTACFSYSVPFVICHVLILLYSWDTKL